MTQELKDSIVHALATMILDNADSPRFQHRCRMAIRDIVTRMPTIHIHTMLVECLSDATNCDVADRIIALISAVQMNG